MQYKRILIVIRSFIVCSTRILINVHNVRLRVGYTCSPLQLSMCQKFRKRVKDAEIAQGSELRDSNQIPHLSRTLKRTQPYYKLTKANLTIASMISTVPMAEKAIQN